MSATTAPVRVLHVGGPADGHWVTVAGTRRTDTWPAYNEPVTRWLDVEHDGKTTRYAIHEIRVGDSQAWVGIPAHIHHPFDYLLSLYSTNALSAKKP